ncbi:DNA-formamidopyrimidine glycosylase family protein, partial [Acinetobacter baumannii]
PDIELYLTCLRRKIVGQSITEFRLLTPFALRTVEPPPGAFVGPCVVELRRIGKRVAFGFESGAWMVVHLMVSGRFRWAPIGAKFSPK